MSGEDELREGHVGEVVRGGERVGVRRNGLEFFALVVRL